MPYLRHGLGGPGRPGRRRRGRAPSAPRPPRGGDRPRRSGAASRGCRSGRSRRCRAPGSGAAPRAGSARRRRGRSRWRPPPARWWVPGRSPPSSAGPARPGLSRAARSQLIPSRASSVKRGAAPGVGCHAPVGLEQLGRRQRPRGGWRRSRAAGPAAPSCAPCPVRTRWSPLQDPVGRALRHGRLRVVLVEERQVVVDVLLLGVHAPQPVLDDHRHLVAEGRVEGAAVGDHRGEDVAVAVLVLQPLAVERGAARRWRRAGSRATACRRRPRPGRRPAGSRTSSRRCRRGWSGVPWIE